ncbi:CidB/LrgB family autolysis modulator [Paenibacillus sp. JX-17]|uniref:CidB/LrgB family autolysis modulator n=1 Tax=Paenibacillus lacisoli TaxID=3064525 RepID=A0ABT9CAU6_9BACL|nr:CidB/LrgB family autolysis modulator [Paenibacillus sp. JX-17]MDO7906390.1 CidB/LrgB family autolysis modulator [Paenibacillus sp. JX-17]
MIGFLCLLLTLGIYWMAKRMYRTLPKVYLSPLLITPIVVVIILLVAGIPYASYQEGGKWLTLLLQPATVAFAVPLYKYYNVLKKHAGEIIVSVLSGSVVAITSTALLARWMHLDDSLMNSIVPRSITTPIAMNVSQVIGGVPTITAIFVIITGLSGILIGPVILRLFRIEGEIARGVLFGTSAHGTGTSKAFELSSLTGTISSISMILAALFTLIAAPLMMGLMGH